MHASLVLLACAAATAALQSVTALVASMGRGYLAPVGWIVLSVALAQILAILGRGALFPWSVPALYSGAVGGDAGLGWASWLAVVATAAAGAVACGIWWNRADQPT